jgi:hypothetical protein
MAFSPKALGTLKQGASDTFDPKLFSKNSFKFVRLEVSKFCGGPA